MQSVFEKYPLPWKIEYGHDITDINGHLVLVIHDTDLHHDWHPFIERINALADIQNPVQWVNDAKFTMEENASILKDAKQRIAELEQQVAQHPQNISDAVYYFANWKISAQDAQEWLSQTQPTAPEDQ